jgi:hypothetical protein
VRRVQDVVAGVEGRLLPMLAESASDEIVAAIVVQREVQVPPQGQQVA